MTTGAAVGSRPLVIGRAYLLAGMQDAMWSSPHAVFGRPHDVAAIFLGSLAGTRTWYLFEVRHQRQDVGVLLMTAADVAQLTITEIGT